MVRTKEKETKISKKQGGGDAWYPEAWSTYGCIPEVWDTECCIVDFCSKYRKINEKINLFHFFEKNKIWFFCWVFHRKCIYIFPRGTRNSQARKLSNFWDIEKIPDFFLKKSKKSRKKWNCSKFFDKIKIWVFCLIFRKICFLIFSKGRWNNQKNILSNF